MRLFRSVFCALAALALMAVLSAAAMADEGYADCCIEPLGMSLSIPEDVRVLTRDMEDSDPNLRGLDMTASQLTYMMTVDRMYLEASRDDGEWVLQVAAFGQGEYSAFDESLRDISEYGSWFRGEMLDSLTEGNPGLTFELVKLGNEPFFMCDDEQDGEFVRTYFSIVNGYEVWVYFYAPADELETYRPVMDDLLSRVTFEKRRTEELPADTDGEETPEEREEEAEANTDPILYELEDDEFTIELDPELYVLWFGMDQDDLALERLGVTCWSVFSQLRNSGNCLDVISPRLNWEMVASTQESGIIGRLGDAALMKEEDFGRIFRMYAGIIRGKELALPDGGTIGIEIGEETPVRIGAYVYYRMLLSYAAESGSGESTVYITAYGGRLYSFTFSGELSREGQEEILSAVRFTAEPAGTARGLSAVWKTLVQKGPAVQKAVAAVLAAAAVGIAAGTIIRARRRRREKAAALPDGEERSVQESAAPACEYSIPGARQDDESGGTQEQ